MRPPPLPGPGRTPELFAPGVVNTDGVEINLVFNRDGTELFFARTVDKVFFIYTSRLVDGAWTAPERLDLYPEGVRGEAVDMALSPDGDSWPTMTAAEIYWLDASIIRELRQQ